MIFGEVLQSPDCYDKMGDMTVFCVKKFVEKLTPVPQASYITEATTLNILLLLLFDCADGAECT